MSQRLPRTERAQFLRLAIASEFILLLVALVLGWFLGYPGWSHVRLSGKAITLGLLATLPLVVLLSLIYQSRLAPLVEFRELVSRLLGRSLVQCNWLDLCVVALLAGVCEEWLFRGVLLPWLSVWNVIFGLIASSLIFGLCHALTTTYFCFATLMGIYLAATLWWTEEANLIVPITCHAVYDLIAFAVVRRSYRLGEKQILPQVEQLGTLVNTPNNPVFPVSQ